jgi:hypothetical protein
MQSYVINAEENDLLGSDGRSFRFLARELQTAVGSDNHRSYNGYRASELLEAINKLAVVDKNKQPIVNSGALASYVKLLRESQSETKSDSGSLAQTTTELFAVAQGLWTLASGCLESVRDQPGCVEGEK